MSKKIAASVILALLMIAVIGTVDLTESGARHKNTPSAPPLPSPITKTAPPTDAPITPAEEPPRVELRTDSTSTVQGDVTLYTNHDLGLSFTYPSKYQLVEEKTSHSADPYVQGEGLEIGVEDETLGYVFSLTAASDDWWTEKFSEGCCYLYTAEPIDLSLDISTLKTTVEQELLKVFIPEKVTVNGTPAFRSMFAVSYIESSLKAMYLVPLEHPLYNNILFESDHLFDTEAKAQTLQSTIFDAHGNTHDWSQYPELDQTKLQAFEDIMATVKLEK